MTQSLKPFHHTVMKKVLELGGHELKEHLRARVIPHNKAEPIPGIKSFWITVDH